MPTLLPNHPARLRVLPWPTVGRLVFLVARIRWLDMRAHALVGRGAGLADDRLLRLMRKWLACHEAVAGLLPGIPEPKHVAEVRAILMGTGHRG
ncbi:hypothetical protein [Methylobacterium sp. J-077]|uniref:hypothetical protein n=1 Tax=Methylobacterium sp. J-077 TaxID=2836656 RepID=UPI001FBAC226|nr:hypothetical protein [Methylobacterium sp. J-077]MCJ2124779.1 hypothetical protein [Methylobacterium sp. J-077]